MHALLEEAGAASNDGCPGSPTRSPPRAPPWATADAMCTVPRRPTADLVGDLPMVSATRPFRSAHPTPRPGGRRVRLHVGNAAGLVIGGGRVRGVRVTRGGAADEHPRRRLRGRRHRQGGASGRGSPTTAGPNRRCGAAPVDLGYATALLRTPPEGARRHGAGAVDHPRPRRPRPGRHGGQGGGRQVDRLGGRLCGRPAAPRLRGPRPLPRRSGGGVRQARRQRRTPRRRRRLPASGQQARDFHKVSRFPAGLVCVGDAVASLNPVYGQGMSSAALHAACLADHLDTRPGPNEPPLRYFKAVRRVVDAAWQTSVLDDLRLPHVDAPRPWGFALQSDRRHGPAGVRDRPEVARKFLDVMHMLAGPDSMMRPGTLARSVRATRRRATGARPEQ
ncbi:hypothetical protein ACU686_03370 [Yinghuangia aomiensis]